VLTLTRKVVGVATGIFGKKLCIPDTPLGGTGSEAQPVKELIHVAVDICNCSK